MTEPLFREIEALPLTERVIAAVKDAFFSGQIKPGDAIVERRLGREMKVGTPVVREALIALQGQGFVRRIANIGTFVTKFSTEELRQLYTVRIELETLALQWARLNATSADLDDLQRLVDRMAEAGDDGNRREYLERDYAFHRRCWRLSGNVFLIETLERLMAPLSAFSVVAGGVPSTAAREHYDIVNALRKLQGPEFSIYVRKTFTTFALRGLASMAHTGDGAGSSR